MPRVLPTGAFVSVLLAAAAVSAAPPPPLPPGNYSQTIRSGDLDRHAIFHVPLGYDGRRPLPLVFVLHGFGGTAASMVNSTGLNAKADAEGFFVAYLDGMPCVPLPGSPCDGSQQGWNNGLTAGAGITADDVGFVRDALRHFQARVRVDIRRVYAAGLSNGAMMCHRLAAELSDLLAAVAPVAGTIGVRQPDGQFLVIAEAVGPIPVVIVHGRSDDNVLYDGGQGSGQGQIYAKSVAEAAAFWSAQNQCQGGVETETTHGGNVTRDSVAACQGNSDVVVYSIADGEHVWPRPNAAGTGLDATSVIWDFFASHPRTAP